MRLRRGLRWAGLLGVLAAPALAVAPGDILYIRARDTGLMERATPTSRSIDVLQPGTAVTYVAPAPKAVGWHQVDTGQRRGFVYQSNLSKLRPSNEVIKTSATPVDPRAFASSGAATKALSEGAVHYGTDTHPDYARAVRDIQAVEAIAKHVKSSQLSAHEQEAHLHVMVGKKEGAP